MQSPVLTLIYNLEKISNRDLGKVLATPEHQGTQLRYRKTNRLFTG
jgi:hypothetical protein